MAALDISVGGASSLGGSIAPMPQQGVTSQNGTLNTLPFTMPTGNLPITPETPMIQGPNGGWIPDPNPTGPVNYSNPSTPTAGGGLSSLLPTASPNTGNNNMAYTPAVGALPPNLGVTAGSAPGTGSLTQGTALPNITTTQAQATATPQFYTDYLNQLATQGAGAAQGAQYVGAQPLQTQAFQQVGQNVGNYQPALTNATNLASSVGGTSLADAIGNYGQANIAANLAPQATAGLVGSGQFGSTRGAQALGQTLSNADLGILAQQQTALQQDQTNKLNAANTLGNLATTTQNLGLGDVNALSTLGAQQQTIGQNAQLFPMSQLTAESNLLKGATIPTATSSTYTGPIPGAYNTSPLAQIAGVGSALLGTSGISGLSTGLSKLVNALPTINFGSGSTDTNSAVSTGPDNSSQYAAGSTDAAAANIANAYGYSNFDPNTMTATDSSGNTLTYNTDTGTFE